MEQEILLKGIQVVGWPAAITVFALVFKPLIPALADFIKSKTGIANANGRRITDLGTQLDKIKNNHLHDVDEEFKRVWMAIESLSRGVGEAKEGIAWLKGRLNGKTQEGL